ncbi:ComEC/Rec2 family competence protein [Camelimonas abortus]|uniref:ComEC/Rec2 family competence protein n=1 Tax=Camelimonas abortus TaxID=1017184 RepID=A0ABV7LAG9_9HYPH
MAGERASGARAPGGRAASRRAGAAAAAGDVIRRLKRRLGPAGLAAAAGGRARELLAAELDRRRHWLLVPAAFALGVLWFFSAHAPGRPWPACVAAAALAVAAATRRGFARFPFILLATLVAGYAVAAARVALLDAPALQGVANVTLSAVVVSVEQRGQGQRLLAAPLAPEGRAGPAPRFVSLSLPAGPPLRPGDLVRGRARLAPPPGPARPGGYDFARDAWVRQTGASGTFTGPVTVTGDGMAAAPWRLRPVIATERGRMALAERIAGAWGGQAGAVAAALVTGRRGQISEATSDALRAAGIYHILSISGLHMALAAGMFFWSARALLALSPWCALRLPLRKAAACVAIAGAAAYCLFSGADVATVRALVMITAMLGAIVADRPALSVHNLALAAMAVLALQPESLLTPGFQMSFAATAALTAVFGEGGRGAASPPAAAGARAAAARWLWRPLRAAVLATLACELATAPFSLWHFNSVYPLGLIGNVLAVPLMSLAVMPAAVAGMALWPLGLDWPAWLLMGAATEPVLWLCGRIAAAPASVALAPAPSAAAFACMVVAVFWFCALATPLRWLALAPALAGAVMTMAAAPPDVTVERAGRGALARLGPDESGREQLALLGAPGPFAARQWLRALGDARDPADPSLRAAVRCDRHGCAAIRPDGGVVAWARSEQGLARACAVADVVVTPLPLSGPCAAPVAFDAVRLAAVGAAHVWLREGEVHVVTARRPGERWPWRSLAVLWPPRERERPPPRSDGGDAPPEGLRPVDE